MGFFDFLRGPDIDAGLQECRNTPGALLLDVRTPEEYAEGHLPSARNLPLQSLEGIASVAPAKDTPLYVYCRSGARSGQATGQLQRMGYTKVTNIGGIMNYHGKVER
ncbi:rhodanese-like domain-containing protein [Gemmiger formicilis]|uniref:rhodanese-like domain-containing protein n=1 Tax=Gemmiger formicilis TaxID=745368 RepID=UPI00195B68A0|nr:rhodanese-like domain-containing protein [Gemmiger formicilis]MBM6898899.1 rhodanese-like domain-containing protein [Gemmiger formicilis]